MKIKTLATVTAIMLAVSAVLLTTALSLLHSSATGEEIAEITEAAPADALEQNRHENDGVSLPDVLDSGNGLQVPEYEYENDIAIDIYEQSTGRLVGQVIITDDAVFDEWESLFKEVFDPNKANFNPNLDTAIKNPLPKGKYRIEVYSLYYIESVYSSESYGSGCAGGISYSYGTEGDNGIYELTQTGLTFSGGYALISYADALIAEEIAAIEAEGTSSNADKIPFSSLIGFDRYWDSIERFTERFPYLDK